ncbi:MAG: ATP-binding protein [Pseudomonadota bacterium]
MTRGWTLGKGGIVLPLAVALLIFASVLTATWIWAGQIFSEELRERARGTLELYISGLDGVLQKHQAMPEVLAKRPEVIALFRHSEDPEIVARANSLTEEVARATGAEDVYFMTPTGDTFAASNWAGERPFVGQNFSYRPYFQNAMKGRLGRFSALGTTSGKRGYYFAYPVIQGDETLGVVVVKIGFQNLEGTWASGTDEVIVADPNGVVFISSRPEWRLKTLEPLEPAALAEIARTRQYDTADLTTLPIARAVKGEIAPSVLAMRRGDDPGGAERIVTYLAEAKDMADADWTVLVLADAAAARARTNTAVIVAALTGLLILAVVAVLYQRRRRLIERIEIERAASEVLESRVRERTAELVSANQRLEEEITERRQAEAELRLAHDELVQAGKLAALGQMSAALSHEFNQPLAAIRSYADNAETLIARGQIEEARDNQRLIRELTQKMAQISKHLTTFARKPGSQLEPVKLAAVVDEALDFLASRQAAAGVQVIKTVEDDSLQVLAGPVRLQQVLLNLLLNALDAMTEQSAPVIEVSLTAAGDKAQIDVRDHGPGIAEDDAARIFDPFFTTKEVGQGLGLGLSISYNIIKDFDGSLSAANHPEGGAVFTIELPLAKARSEAAE